MTAPRHQSLSTAASGAAEGSGGLSFRSGVCSMDNSFRLADATSTEYDCIGLCASRPGPKLQKTKKTRGDDAGKTGAALLANLEHVFRIPRHPVRLRAPERECQPHLPVARRLD